MKKTKWSSCVFIYSCYSIVLLFLSATGCMSTSYRISPVPSVPAPSTTINSIMLRQFNIMRGGAVDAVLTSWIRKSLEERIIYAPSQDKYVVDVLINVPVGGASPAAFAFLPCLFTMTLFPSYFTDSDQYFGNVTVYDSMGQTVMSELIHPRTVQFKSYFSIFPTGLLAFMEPATYKSWTQVGDLYAAERIAFRSDSSEPMVLRIVLDELLRVDGILRNRPSIVQSLRDVSQTQPPSKQEQEILRIKRLYDEGLIDNDEYKNARTKIIETL